MKKNIFILLLVLAPSLKTLAQNKVDKFCTVRLRTMAFDSKKVRTEISTGEEKSLFNLKDTTYYQKLKLVNSFITESDVLNYMSKLGWSITFINYHSGSGLKDLYFKKTFDEAELVEDKN